MYGLLCVRLDMCYFRECVFVCVLTCMFFTCMYTLCVLSYVVRVGAACPICTLGRDERGQ